MDIAEWLESLGLRQYEQAFRDNHIDEKVLPRLTADDLTAIGMTSVGHRRTLLSAIASLTLAPSPAEPPIAVRPAGAERRQLTVMFCDIVGSTALAQRLDPEDTREVIGVYQNAVTKEIARFQGHIAKFMGDGVLVYFGWPKGYEDDAERAVRAGLAIVDAVGKLSTPAKAPLRVRIGIATGIVVVGDLVGEGSAQEEAVVGETPNLAARLQGLAQPDSVVVAELTHKLLGGLFVFADMGTHEPKGFTGSVRAWRVVGEGQTEGRFEALHGPHVAPLVGREHELGLLVERFERAKGGEGQVVLLSGEAGIGKSRLVLALRERLDIRPQWSLRYQGSPHQGNSALSPVISQLQRAAQIADDDPPGARFDKLKRLLVLSGSDVTSSAPPIAELLSIRADGQYEPLDDLTPQQRKARTFNALLAQVDGLAAQHPPLIVLEDAHWLDPTTLEFFGLVVERIQRLPVLLVVTFRPQFNAPWKSHAHVMQLTLGGLARAQAAAVVARIAGGKMLPPVVLEQILAKTEGLPLFVEELTKAVLESGLLTDAGDHYELSGPLQSLAIPATLSDSLMARLDRLASVRNVAQIGSVIGREFGHDLLAAVAGMDAANLEAALAQLVEAELIFRRGMQPDASYVFRHALVQDAVYGSLLRAQRHDLHARVAHELETRSPELAETSPELLAHHLTAAGFAERAVPYWQRAGVRASRRSAHLEAIAHFTEGLKLLATLTDDRTRASRELALLLDLGPVYMSVRGMGSPQVADTYSRALELAREFGTADQVYAAMWGLWLSHQNRGLLPEAGRLADEVLALASTLDDPGLLLQAHHAAWTTLFFQNDIQSCLEHTERGIALYDIKRHAAHSHRFGAHDPGACARMTGALTLWLRGYPDKGVAQSSEGVALAYRLEQPRDVAGSLFFRTMLYQYRREANDVTKSLDDLAVICADQGISHFEASVTMLRGWADVTQGKCDKGIVQLQHGMAMHDRSPAGLRKAYYAALLVEGYLRTGDVDSGLSQIEASLTRVKDVGDHHWRPELLRLRGDLLALVPDQKAAEEAFNEALACAREQKCRMLELRAAMSLSRLWAVEGESRRAHALLSPLYAEFTEGFDTDDLKDAKALRDQLSQ